jgi:hypothetical protein
MKKLAAQRLNKSFDQTFSKVWPPAGPPEGFLAWQLFNMQRSGAAGRREPLSRRPVTHKPQRVFTLA